VNDFDKLDKLYKCNASTNQRTINSSFKIRFFFLNFVVFVMSRIRL